MGGTGGAMLSGYERQFSMLLRPGTEPVLLCMMGVNVHEYAVCEIMSTEGLVRV